MLIKKLLPFSISVLLLLPTLVFSETQEIKEYKVQGGDTLWNISGKELQDPFLWPKIWKENQEIKNPDMIYPDQTIKIPLYLLQKEEKIEEPLPEPVAEKTVEPIKEEVKVESASVEINPIVSEKIYIASGYVTDYVNSLGEILGSPTGRNLFGNNDLVYVKTHSATDIGNKFYVVRKGQEVTHPATKQKMGYVAEIVGVAEVSKFEYGETLAKILVAFKEIATGDILDMFYEMEPPVVQKPFRKPNIEGYVLATKDLRIMNSNYNIVYIDKGKANGLKQGDIVKTLSVSARRVPNGTLQIISLQKNTATAIVVSSSDSIMAGNQIMQAE
jgi:LysM repeat protein